MNPIFSASLEIQEFCHRRAWRFCFIGAVAVQRWGEPRLTQDVDLTLLTGFGAEQPFVDALLAAFKGRRPDARDFALRYRVLLLEAGNGIPLDVLTCSAEDLVVLKAFAGRDKDWLDIEGVILRQADRLQEALIWQELEPLLDLKGSPETADRLRALLRRSRG